MGQPVVAVIDYGMGNLHSAAKALEHVAPDAKVLVSSSIDEIRSADRVVFPGVGAIRDCMAEIRRLGFDALLPQLVGEKPVLAICVGMQALLESSDENEGVPCIGLVPGVVTRFSSSLQDTSGEPLKVPHMGWNCVHQVIDHPMWHAIDQDARFYFVHSFYVQPTDPALVAATTEYGHPFCSALCAPNLFAVQFHPEKSHEAGLQLLANFMAWDGNG